MGSQILFHVGLLLMILPFVYIVTQGIKDYRQPDFCEEINNLFHMYWNGDPEDRLNAWYKVRLLLLMREESEEKLNYVERKIQKENKHNFLGSTYVRDDGEWVGDDIRPFHKA